jgi:hypothetical protein
VALDCYICDETNDGRYCVHRFKATEKLDTTNFSIGVISSARFNELSKRERIVQKFVTDGKPRFSVYWYEGNEIKSTTIPKTKDTNPNDKIAIGNITNGYAVVWYHGKQITVRVPPGITNNELLALMKRVRGEDPDKSDGAGVSGSADAGGQ